MSGERLTLAATDAEAEELAIARTAATGIPCCVVTFTGSDRARVMDLDLENGTAVDHGTVPLVNPSPGVVERLPDGPEA